MYVGHITLHDGLRASQNSQVLSGLLLLVMHGNIFPYSLVSQLGKRRHLHFRLSFSKQIENP